MAARSGTRLNRQAAPSQKVVRFLTVFLVGLPQLQDPGSRRQEDGQGRPVGNPSEFQWRDAIHATFTVTERRGGATRKAGRVSGLQIRLLRAYLPAG